MEGHPSLSSTPTSPMSLNDILSGNMGSQNQALKNLQALAKLGGMSIGDHGKRQSQIVTSNKGKQLG